MQQWRNYGTESHLELFFCGVADPDKRKQQTVARGLAQAVSLAKTQPVLLIVYTEIALVPEVMPLLDGVTDNKNITLLLVGKETIGAEPPTIAKLDAALTFTPYRGQNGRWPAIDPIRSYSTAYANEIHAALAWQARRLFRRYEDLRFIFEKRGMAGFDVPLYDDREKTAVLRARRLHRYLAQPLVIMEPWTALIGTTVPLSETCQIAQDILAGKFDSVPEESI